MRDLLDFLSSSNIKINPDFISSLNHDTIQFHYRNASYPLPDASKQRLESYLALGQPFLSPFGNIKQANTLIAFSFGDSTGVNKQLCHVAQEINTTHPNIHVQMQQEVALHCSSTKQISIITNTEYQTTTDIAKKALLNTSGRDVVVVAQSWHARRCIDTCIAQGWNVVALRCVDDFPKHDPQPWVRNPLNWLIKESHREVATGYEISEYFSLK